MFIQHRQITAQEYFELTGKQPTQEPEQKPQTEPHKLTWSGTTLGSRRLTPQEVKEYEESRKAYSPISPLGGIIK
ncbi:hypothetical protein HY772_10140 [Candidatus Woesearchaeota archaeon]|nr:hypothetical protein [Candidatus Woesearchaeota archaeon]